jgi:hypothetical protein
VTVEWLTAVLTRSGALTGGRVETFALTTKQRELSANARLQLTYTAGSQGTLPPRLFLKMVVLDMEDEFFGPSEVDYYTRDYVGLAGAPLLRCYDGVYSEEQRRYHLLLDDVSDSHVEAAEKGPTLAYGLALAEGLAGLHAHWWGAKRLAEAGAAVPNAAQIHRFVAIAEPGVEHILGHFADQLESHWPALVRELFGRHPQALIERAGNDNGFTLIHGDAGQRNILVPREGERPIYLIDRQPFDWSLTTWLGVYDLAYAMVLDWDVPTRRRLELPVLHHYHQQLIQNRVEGYSWERLWDDYRLSAAMGVYVATEYCRGGVNEAALATWLPMLQQSLTACDDLNCHELW